jgi:3'-phosphoadenosine 5'-phosphosulfate sulfotransferase
MNKYKVNYNGKTYFYTGENTREVAEKFENRKVFGSYLIVNMRLKMYDAETRGVKWAEYTADNKPVLIEIVTE